MKPARGTRLALAFVVSLSALGASGAEPWATAAAREFGAPGETLSFAPKPDDMAGAEIDERIRPRAHEKWLRPAYGDPLVTDIDEWRTRAEGWSRLDLLVDYNRVDRTRLGVGSEFQWDRRLYPRLGGRLEWAFDRKRLLYGAQIEQPVIRNGRVALGVSMERRTDHGELQQVENVENSMALLFARQDYRDYFEREGLGAYLSWRVPDFSTVSVHLRNDEYRTLALKRGTRSFFHRGVPLRDNPAIEEGESHSMALRLERHAHRTEATGAGFYHWIQAERAGKGLGGDFSYARLLADLRTVIRLAPAQTLAIRAVGGHTFDGSLPLQKQFTLGGIDGLRAHPFAAYRGDQVLLAQAEYTIGLWPVRSTFFDAGLHAIAFVDFGRAWSNRAGSWDVSRQHIQTDGGVGLATSEDNLRFYFAKDLAEPDSNFLVTVRLNRPF